MTTETVRLRRDRRQRDEAPKTKKPRKARRKIVPYAPQPVLQALPEGYVRLVDLERDELHPVSQLARRLCGRLVSGPTLWRWITRGIPDGAGGIARLEAYWIGGRWCTSAAAMKDFVHRQTIARLTKRQREPIDASDAELAEAGLI